MIYLSCEVKSGLGEDTFWTWFEREFSCCSFTPPSSLKDEDILLRYSTLGFYPINGKQVSLCWELYPQMKKLFSLDMWESTIIKINESARYATYRTVATQLSVDDYSRFGSVDVIPIGVNTDLYYPLNKKEELRSKYNLPLDKEIGIWIGTYHPMKGYDDLLLYAANNPEIYWVCVWKWDMEALPLKNGSNYVKIPQNTINELINASDFFACTNRLPSYYMSEWEAMATSIPFRYLNNYTKEFFLNKNSRETVFEMGWDRKSVKIKWQEYFELRGVKC